MSFRMVGTEQRNKIEEHLFYLPTLNGDISPRQLFCADKE